MATDRSATERQGALGAGLGAWISARREQIEATLASRIPAPTDDPGRLVEAMRYSLLSPGKRLRPLLALAAAETVTGAADDAGGGPVRTAAAAVELIHCYSLVHDDLPAMDDDDFRRGRPSNHKVFGEAAAILAGDALLTLAFEWLAEAGQESGRPDCFGRAALALARGAGMSGMVRGQARDLGEAAPADLPALERLHGEKTAALFQAAVEVGAAAAGAAAPVQAQLGTFGHLYGVAFQHADDLDDGDHPGHAEHARARLRALVTSAVRALDPLGPSSGATVLRGLAEALVGEPG